MATMKFSYVNWGVPQFEKKHKTLMDFTEQFLNCNRNRVKTPTRQEVDWHWEQQVTDCYKDSDNKLRIFLLEQRLCPAIQQFWEEQDDVESWSEKRDFYKNTYTFHQAHRNLSKAERKTSRWAVIMNSTATGDIIVPDVRVFPLHRISYAETARKVLAANPEKKLQKHEMEDLWDGLMYTVYDFEVTLWERKRTELMSGIEYRKLQEDAKTSRKRKRGDISDTSDIEAQPRTTKQKTTTRMADDHPCQPAPKEWAHATSKIEVTSHDTVGAPPATPVVQHMATPHGRNSRQRAPGVLPTGPRAKGERAPSQATNEPLQPVSTCVTADKVARPPPQPANQGPAKAPATSSNQAPQPPTAQANPVTTKNTAPTTGNQPLQPILAAKTRVAATNTVAQPRANQAPSRPPMTGSNPTPQPPSTQAHQFPARGRGNSGRPGNDRGNGRGGGRGGHQPDIGQRRPLDPEATRIPAPTRNPNTPPSLAFLTSRAPPPTTAQRRPLDPEATLIPIPTRAPNPPPPPAAPTPAPPAPTTGPGGRRLSHPERDWNISNEKLEEWADEHLENVGWTQFKKEQDAGMWTLWKNYDYRKRDQFGRLIKES